MKVCLLNSFDCHNIVFDDQNCYINLEYTDDESNFKYFYVVEMPETLPSKFRMNKIERFEIDKS